MRAISILGRFLYDTGAARIGSPDCTLTGETLKFKPRFAIFLMMALSLLRLGTVAAQDAGQFVILNAQYGTERNHVDITNRLKELARRERPFRISHDSMDADPDHGVGKALRVFARGPNGRERMFEFPDGSGLDGGQVCVWGRADW